MSADEKGLHGDGRPTISREEREARKVFRGIEAKEAMSDNARAKQAFADNDQLLRTERQAREAAEPLPAKGKTTPKKGAT